MWKSKSKEQMKHEKLKLEKWHEKGKYESGGRMKKQKLQKYRGVKITSKWHKIKINKKKVPNSCQYESGARRCKIF